VNHHGGGQSIPHGIRSHSLAPSVCISQLSAIKIVTSIILNEIIIGGEKALVESRAYVEQHPTKPCLA
jgi:hypothetical protein